MSIVARTSTPALGEVLELMRLIWKINRGLELSSRRIVATLGISGPQRLALRIIGRFPRITAGELSDILHLDRSTTSTLVAGLCKKQLVSRKKDPGDKRRMPLTLTEQGRALDVPSPGTVEAVVTQIVATLDPKTRRDGALFLQLLGDALQPQGDSA